MCTQNWPTILRDAARENTLLGGLEEATRCTGLASDKKKNMEAVISPLAVICRSPFFSPRRYSALIMYALMRQLRAKILNTWMVVTSVQRPCRSTVSTACVWRECVRVRVRVRVCVRVRVSEGIPVAVAVRVRVRVRVSGSNYVCRIIHTSAHTAHHSTAQHARETHPSRWTCVAR